MLKNLGLKRLGLAVGVGVLAILLIFAFLIFRANQALEGVVERDLQLAQQRAGLEQQRTEATAETQQLLRRYTELGFSYESALKELEGKAFNLLNEVMAFAKREQENAAYLQQAVLKSPMPESITQQMKQERSQRLMAGEDAQQVAEALRAKADELKITAILQELDRKNALSQQSLAKIDSLTDLSDDADKALKKLSKKLAKAQDAVGKAYLKYDLSDHRIGLRIDRYIALQTERISLLMSEAQAPAQRNAKAALDQAAAITQQGNQLVARESELSALLKQLSEETDNVSASTQEAQSERKLILESVQQRIVALLVVLAVLILILGILANGLIGQRILALASAMRGVSQKGDLGLRLNADGQDELGQIAGDFNGFADKIQQVVTEIDAQMSKLSRTGQRVVQVGEQNHRNTQQLDNEIQHIAQALSLLEEHTDAMADSAQLTQASTRDASTLMDECAPVVQKSLDASQLVNTTAQDACQRMERLSEASAQIHNVLNVIGDIAEQTNLLALNAAIEAARAGEQGRGFAVVADEVRALAHKTQESTKQIEAQISQLTGTTQEATHSIGLMSERSLESHQAAATVDSVLKQLAELVNQISARNSQIAEGANQQRQETQQINHNLSGINELLKNTEVGAKDSEAISLDLEGMVRSLSQITQGLKS